ncbi:DUF6249 domain-containing protein [Phenylobacterium sp.]|uniref:DUF6249 domain-containing protein n=1 Tax=Phenylobacterium sp. TaxID=1871053 RepID=UPI002F3F6C79
MIGAVQILIALLVPGLVVMFSAFLRSRERIKLLDVILATSQAGQPVSPELIRSLPGGREVPAPRLDLRRGVILIAIGAALAAIGLCTYFGIASERGDGAVAWGVAIAAVGAIPISIGIALVYLSRADRGAIAS